MAGVKGRPTEAIPKHRILREVVRHFLEFEALVSSTGKSVIDHGYFIYEEDGETVKGKEIISISFWDLHDALSTLSDRKREAVFYNVILDWKQRDVAEKMGITTVSVGQYVEQAMLQLADDYFAEEKSEEADGESDNGSRPRRKGRGTSAKANTMGSHTS
jgi:hypothetical protein